MSITMSISKISDLLDRWRAMGSQRLPNGVELLGEIPDQGEKAWLHAYYPPLRGFQIEAIEQQLGALLPNGLRAFYRGCGGLSAFGHLFEIHGYRPSSMHLSSGAHAPEDIVRLNRMLDTIGWKPSTAVAFATNAWDCSVYVLGMTDRNQEVCKCRFHDGEILARSPDIFDCVKQHLYSLEGLTAEDEMQVGATLVTAG